MSEGRSDPAPTGADKRGPWGLGHAVFAEKADVLPEGSVALLSLSRQRVTHHCCQGAMDQPRTSCSGDVTLVGLTGMPLAPHRGRPP